MSCRATSWWATTGRARASSTRSHPPMPAGRPACITVRSHPEAGAFFTRSTATILKTRNEHLQSLRDVRFVYIDSFFFFQAEDGIRDLTVTGVQTCALPI